MRVDKIILEIRKTDELRETLNITFCWTLSDFLFNCSVTYRIHHNAEQACLHEERQQPHQYIQHFAWRCKLPSFGKAAGLQQQALVILPS